MPIELYSGWLVKDGGSLGSAKKRFCVLSLLAENSLQLDYYVDAEMTQKKGTFLLATDCNFTKLSDTKFKISLAGGSRIQGRYAVIQSMHYDNRFE